MGSTMVRGKYLIAGASGPGEVAVLEDGAFFQRDGIIVEVGMYADLAGRYRADETLGSPRHVVMPGLVNGHHHVGLTRSSSDRPTIRSSSGSPRGWLRATWTPISTRCTRRSR